MKRKKAWVATVVIESKDLFGYTNNDEREKVLHKVLSHAVKNTTGDGIFIFPGGFLNTGRKKAVKKNYSHWVNAIKSKLKQYPRRKLVVCLGIDGRLKYTKYLTFSKDQLALAINKKGLMAMGRKFHPSPIEIGQVELARDHEILEDGKSRIFSLHDKKYFLAVCYDVFGIKHKAISNPGVDCVLDFIHTFTPRGLGVGSGDVYFAKNGFAGVSKRWKCPVYGAVTYFRRRIPERWPTGVVWNGSRKKLRKWKYSDNPITASQDLRYDIPEGKASIKIYY